ncbi:MAG: cupin domain-containing protein [Rhodospirillaceae bacterium]|nr:cupin domain-containing protein [Rhodospirillaceae bacterium]
MRVIQPADIAGTHRDRMVADGKAHAMCCLAEEDGCGFSFSTLMIDGDSTGYPLHYRNHIEANMILEGSGEAKPLGPGAFYCVGPNDRYRLELAGPWKVVSFFNPAIDEGAPHGPDGFPESGDLPAGWEPGGRTMFVRQPGDIEEKMLSTGFSSVRRPLLSADGTGLSLSDLLTTPGEKIDLWYRNHCEANYLVEGSAEVWDKATDERHALTPGDMFVIGPRDKHRVSNTNGVRFLSIFNPPIKGDERYDDKGGYPPTGDVPEAWQA